MLLDACRHDYLSALGTPFLWRCAQEGTWVRRVIPSPGFCERTEIFTGQRAADSGFFAAIGFNPPESYYCDSLLLKLLGWFEALVAGAARTALGRPFEVLRRALRRHLPGRRRIGKAHMAPYAIPLEWLHLFALTEDAYDHRGPGVFGVPSIFDLLRLAERRVFFDSFSALGMRVAYDSDPARLEAVRKDVASDAKDLYLIYIAALDAAGHRYGPESPELRLALSQVDAQLAEFAADVQRIQPAMRFVFIGDHGMHRVEAAFDAESELKALFRRHGVRRGRDIVYFLDSTMVRIWYRTERGRTLTDAHLRAAAGFAANGQWLDESLARAHGIPWPDARYGDRIWLARTGVVVRPDFFNGFASVRGMHGYVGDSDARCGMCVVWGGSGGGTPKSSAMHLSDLFAVIREELGS